MSDIIYTPPASSGGGTTINPTNNFIPKRQNATTFIDSVLENGSNYLYANYGGYTGLGLDFANREAFLGDWNNLINGTALVLSDINQTIYTINNGFAKGINLDFNLLRYNFGDLSTNYLEIDSINTLCNLIVNSTSWLFIDGTALVGTFGFSQNQVQIDANTRSVFIGDPDFNGNWGATLICEDNNGQIKTKKSSSNNCGLLLDFQYNFYVLGDYDSNNNGTQIQVDDTSKQIYILNNSGYFDFADPAFLSGSAGGSSGDHLIVYVNGTQYKIALLNP